MLHFIYIMEAAMAEGSKRISVYMPSRLSTYYKVRVTNDDDVHDVLLCFDLSTVLPNILFENSVQEESVKDLLEDVENYEKASIFYKMRRRLITLDSENPIQVQLHKLTLVCEDLFQKQNEYQGRTNSVLNRLIARANSKKRVDVNNLFGLGKVYSVFSQAKNFWQGVATYMEDILRSIWGRSTEVVEQAGDEKCVDVRHLYKDAADNMKREYFAKGKVSFTKYQKELEGKKNKFRVNSSAADFGKAENIGQQEFSKAVKEIELFEEINTEMQKWESQAIRRIADISQSAEGDNNQLEQLESKRVKAESLCTLTILFSDASRDLQQNHGISQETLSAHFLKARNRIEQYFTGAREEKDSHDLHKGIYSNYQGLLKSRSDLLTLFDLDAVKRQQGTNRANSNAFLQALEKPAGRSISSFNENYFATWSGIFRKQLDDADAAVKVWEILLHHHKHYQAELKRMRELTAFCGSPSTSYRDLSLAHATVLREAFLAFYGNEKTYSWLIDSQIKSLIQKFDVSLKEDEDELVRRLADPIRNRLKAFTKELTENKEFFAGLNRDEVMSDSQAWNEFIETVFKVAKEEKSWNVDISGELKQFQAGVAQFLFGEMKDQLPPKGGENFAERIRKELSRLEAGFLNTLLFSLLAQIEQKDADRNYEIARHFLCLKTALENYIQTSLVNRVGFIVSQLRSFQSELPLLFIKKLHLMLYEGRVDRSALKELLYQQLSEVSNRLKSEVPELEMFIESCIDWMRTEFVEPLLPSEELLVNYQRDPTSLSALDEESALAISIRKAGEAYNKYLAVFTMRCLKKVTSNQEVEEVRPYLQKEMADKFNSLYEELYARLKTESPLIQMQGLVYAQKQWSGLFNKNEQMNLMIRVHLHDKAGFGEVVSEDTEDDQECSALFNEFTKTGKDFASIIWVDDQAVVKKLMQWQRDCLNRAPVGSKKEEDVRKKLGKICRAFWLSYHPDKYKGALSQKAAVAEKFPALIEELEGLIELTKSTARRKIVNELSRPEEIWMKKFLASVTSQEIAKAEKNVAEWYRIFSIIEEKSELVESILEKGEVVPESLKQEIFELRISLAKLDREIGAFLDEERERRAEQILRRAKILADLEIKILSMQDMQVEGIDVPEDFKQEIMTQFAAAKKLVLGEDGDLDNNKGTEKPDDPSSKAEGAASMSPLVSPRKEVKAAKLPASFYANFFPAVQSNAEPIRHSGVVHREGFVAAK